MKSLNQEILNKKDLENLHSNYYYYNFDNEKGICEDVPFYSSIKADLEAYVSLKNDSDKLAKAFCYIYNRKKNKGENFDNEFCDYLYYWIGEKVFNKLNNKSYFSNIISMLYHRLNKTDISEICKPLYINISFEDFRNNKLLYEYSKDHVNISHHTVYVNATCDEEYNKVMRNYIDTYKDAYSDCYEKHEQRYDCNTFFNLFEKDQYSKLTSFNCKVPQKEVVSLDEQERPADPEDLRDGHPPTVRATDPEFRPEHRNSDDLDNNHRSERAGDLVDDASTQLDGKPENAFSKNVVNTTLPLLAASSFTFLLYKVITNIIKI
ncbi:hypothetical protein PVBG_05563 [Plasmodium vivax Brazil I]|uniref:Uncharacterized protein n=1 Tax=Plasmodium vivax (strain Brazil I) TaxID=1033975 RepID=A0A0J9T287_PLAV1|nr:hypothetical protein PVBG_05563 [Plasmodium vivax Brazil I]